MNKLSLVIVVCMFVVPMFVVPMFVVTGQTEAVELLSNGDFELVGGGVPPGWSLDEFPSTGMGSFNTAEQVGFADVNNDPDELGLWLKPFAGGANPPGRLVNAILSQIVPATAGEGYSFSGWSNWEFNYSGRVTTLDQDSPFGAIPSPTRTEMELAFLDTGGSVIGIPHLLDLRTEHDGFDVWVEHDFNALFGGGSPLVAPAGTASVRVSASMIDGAFNVDPEQSAFVDDFSLIAASAPGAQLLTNGNLDIGPPPPSFVDWVTLEDPEGVDTIDAQPFAQNPNTAGATGAFLHPWANDGLVSDPNDAILSQTVPGVEGGNYTFSGWSRFETNYSGGVDTLDSLSPNGAVPSPTQTSMVLAFLDGSGTEIGTPITLDLRSDRESQTGNANDGEWLQHTMDGIAPAGTALVQVTASMIDGVFNIDPAQSAFFDDFSLDGPPVGVDGDFNGDGSWDCADINALTAAVASASTDLAFDMNGDGAITLADVTDASVGWLAVGGANNPGATGGNPFVSGDADLSGAVDVSDFNIWNTNKFTSVDAWCSGDFTADGSVDVSDFNTWNSNKFTSSSGVAAVPEPGTAALLTTLLATLGVLLAGRRQ